VCVCGAKIVGLDNDGRTDCADVSKQIELTAIICALSGTKDTVCSVCDTKYVQRSKTCQNHVSEFKKTWKT